MVYLTKIDASRNVARFYALDLQPMRTATISAVGHKSGIASLAYLNRR